MLRIFKTLKKVLEPVKQVNLNGDSILMKK